MQFVHLKTYSEFSLKKGTNLIKDMVSKAVDNNMPALAITESNGLHSAVGFYEATRGKGVKPIIGCDLTIEQDDGKTYNLTVLAKNQKGYSSLVALNSRSYLENRTSEESMVKEEWLTDLEDVVVLSGGKNGLLGKLILEGNMEEAIVSAKQMQSLFNDDFYMELQRDASPEQNKYMRGAIEICKATGIPPVATHPVLFPTRDDFVAHEVRHCVASKEKFAEVARKREFNPEMYFKSTKEMVELFKDIPVAIENTVRIAEKCSVSLTLGVNHLPRFETPTGEDETTYFVNFSRAGLEKRLEKIYPNPEERAAKRTPYDERFEREVGIISKMEFPGYFLIVSDFINWAKDHDIPIGPGRGSGAGSLVAYAMGITDVDPLPYNLLFERFLNPERVSMPDFDIDMCQNRRGEIIEYVRNKYGSEAVCQIGTFSTMATKSVIRDVGRAIDMHYDEVDQIAKMIFIPVGKSIPLKTYIWGGKLKDGTEHPADEKLLDRYNNDRRTKKLIDIALRLEGMTKNMGTHASGVLIAPNKITDFTSVYTISKGAAPVSQFDMSDVEKAGLVKFDFLGLKNLTIIRAACKLVEERHNVKIDMESIDLQDKDILKNVFASGNTTSVFQFESKGMKSVLKRAKPEKFEDLAALNALFRPGPMAIIDPYIEAKENPSKRVYPHPLVEDILKETYGFMVYQEQVMQVAQTLGGYTLGGADLLRRAMGKKKVEEMQKHREIFCEGAGKNGLDREHASEIFDLMEKFAGYGFNKSHAVAYALVAYQTGYLKHYYPSEFLTANLNSAANNAVKVNTLFQDCRENGIKLKQVDINQSDELFKIESDGSIRYAMTAVKGVAEKDIVAIQKEREQNGPFLDIFDFTERVTAKGRSGKRTMEGLIKAGAFDSIDPNRAFLFEAIPVLGDYAKEFKKFKSTEIKRLDSILTVAPVVNNDETTIEPETKKGGLKRALKSKAVKEVKVIEAPVRPVLQEVEPWHELMYAQKEKEVLGMFFSVNPFNSYYAKNLSNPGKGLDIVSPLSTLRDIASENDSKYGTKVFIAGMIEEIFLFSENKGARVKLTDGTATEDIVLFKEPYATYKETLKVGNFISVVANIKFKETEENPVAPTQDFEVLDFEGEVLAPTEESNSRADADLDVFANQVFTFEHTKNLLTQVMFVGIPNTEESLEVFNQIASQYPGTNNPNTAVVKVYVEDPETGQRRIPGPVYSINASEDCEKDMKKAFGEKFVHRKFKENLDKVAFPELPLKGKNKKGYKNR